MTGLAVSLVKNQLTWGELDSGHVANLKNGTKHISAAALVPFAALVDTFTNYLAYAAVYAVIGLRKIVQLVSAKTDFLKQVTAEKAKVIFNHANVSFFLLAPSGLQGLYDPQIQQHIIDNYYVRTAAAKDPASDKAGEADKGRDAGNKEQKVA